MVGSRKEGAMDQGKPNGMLPSGSHFSADIVFAGSPCSAEKQKMSLAYIVFRSQVPRTQESLSKDVQSPDKWSHVSLVLSSFCLACYKVGIRRKIEQQPWELECNKAIVLVFCRRIV